MLRCRRNWCTSPVCRRDVRNEIASWKAQARANRAFRLSKGAKGVRRLKFFERMKKIKRVCVFCGSSFGKRPAYREAAEGLGRLLAEHGIGLVYGGGCVGLMGALANAVLACGGEVIGVIPDSLMRRVVGHRGVTKLHVVETMHERKKLMADLADAFIALPGGYGTLEELLEAVTWSQLGIQQKPCGLLNVENYWDGLLKVLD